MISGFHGQYRDDDAARAVYSEAAGIARIMPRAVAVPRSIDDVCALVRWAHETHTPLIPRGSGSSMGGGAVGDGVIVDLSRLNAIGSVDVEQRRVHVGPGVLRDEVDRAARAVGLRFPPDPSSGAFCTVGGMIATNAAGAHTLKFGATRAWVTAIDCVFDDGSRATLVRGQPVPTNVPALARVAQIADELRQRGAADAATHRVKKESSGYAVRTFVEQGDVVDLLIGSEGTLALVVGATLALIPVAGATSALLGAFASLDDAVTAAIRAREEGAAACELLDRTYLDIVAARGPLPNVPEESEAVLLAEVEGDTTQEAEASARALARIFGDAGATAVTLALTPVDETELWELRHAASPTLATLGPTLCSMQFIEDGAVPPDRFADYVRGIRRILTDHGLVGVIFGHAGDAHAHVNPLIDTSRLGWRGDLSSILSEVVKLTAQLGGTLTAEHGDGRLRTPLLKRVWSPEAVALFAMVKTAFDPDNIFNPGVKVPQPSQRPIVDVKYDPALPPLPAAAAAALGQVARDRSYHAFRLDLLDSAS
jgi:FAD/FMN-containing dehydrogenase